MKEMVKKLTALALAAAMAVSLVPVLGEELPGDIPVAEFEQPIAEIESELDGAVEEIGEIGAMETAEEPAPIEVSETVEAPASAEAVATEIVEAAPASARLMEAGSTEGVESVTVVNKMKLTLNVGETRQLVVNGKVKGYKSSKKKVASVSKGGLVTAKKAGKSKVTVTLKGKKKRKLKLTVKVVDPYAPTGVSIANGKSITIAKGESVQLNAVLAPETAQSGLTWKSSKKKIASVNGSGVVTGKKKGKTTITVKTRNGKKAKIKVTVKKASATASSGQRIDLTTYFGQNLAQIAGQFGLEWSDPTSITGSYTNDELDMGWSQEKYWEDAKLETVTIKKDPQGKYSAYGVYLGMSKADACALLNSLGFTGPSEVQGTYLFYSGNTGVHLEFGSNGEVTRVYVSANS